MGGAGGVAAQAKGSRLEWLAVGEGLGRAVRGRREGEREIPVLRGLVRAGSEAAGRTELSLT